MRYFLIILFLVCSSGFAFSQNGKKVQFVGGARSLNTLAELDSASIPKRSGGYALLDFIYISGLTYFKFTACSFAVGMQHIDLL